MKKFVFGFLFPFLLFVLIGYSRTHGAVATCPTPKCFQPSHHNLVDSEERSLFLFDKPAIPHREQEVFEICNVTEVEEGDEEGSSSLKRANSVNHHFQTAFLDVQTFNNFFRNSKKSLSFYRHLTSISSRRQIMLRVIRI